MTISINPAKSEDIDAIVKMNNAAVPEVNELDGADIERFLGISPFFRVARSNDEIAGFLIALEPEADYGSENFRWFRDRYDKFLYIDRVVVSASFRRAGVGRVLYADVQSYAEQRHPILTCEVNIEPRNDVSLLFHSTIGFREVGVLTGANGKTVSLLAKMLSCFEFVRQRELEEQNSS